MTKERDIKLFKNIVHFYNFTGTFPCVSIYKKMLLIAYYFIGLLYFLKKTITHLRVLDLTALGLTIYAVNVALFVAFSLSCLHSAVSGAILWDNFFSTVDEFDSIINIQNIYLEETVSRYYFSFIVTNAIYGGLFCLVLSTFAISVDYQSAIGGLYFFITNIQMLLTILALAKVFAILEKRYECLKRKLRQTYLFMNKSGKFFNGRPLNASYSILVNMFNIANKIFGQRILVIMAITFLHVLTCFHYVFCEDSSNANVIAVCAYTGFSLVSFWFYL